MNDLERLDAAPGFVQRVVRWRVTSSMKKVHFGQVVPIEDVGRIFDFVTSIVRVGCICRYSASGIEYRYCYGVSMAPNGGQLGALIRRIDPGYLMGPDAAGLERLTKEEALAAFSQHEREGLCHSVWTFLPPFIGAICNCDRSDCLAMRATVTHATPVMFRAEYVAAVEPEPCNGCRACRRICPFGAMTYSAAHKKVAIDPRRCYGCGACRCGCKKDAIRLHNRSSVRLAANLWWWQACRPHFRPPRPSSGEGALGLLVLLSVDLSTRVAAPQDFQRRLVLRRRALAPVASIARHMLHFLLV